MARFSSNPWKFRGMNTSWKDANPLGKFAERFILENPQWVLYLRRDWRFPCPYHYSEAGQSGTVHLTECSVCYGLGVRTIPQVVPARINYESAMPSSSEGDMRMGPGYLSRFIFTVDVPRWVYPSTGDFILICEWDKPAQQIATEPVAKPIRLDTALAIRQTNPHFEREIGWVECGCESVDLRGDLLSSLLPRISGFEVLKETWQQDQKSYW